jgi:hypothetical protein
VLVASVAAGAIAAGASSVFTGVNLYQSWDRTPDAFTRVSHVSYDSCNLLNLGTLTSFFVF